MAVSELVRSRDELQPALVSSGISGFSNESLLYSPQPLPLEFLNCNLCLHFAFLLGVMSFNLRIWKMSPGKADPGFVPHICTKSRARVPRPVLVLRMSWRLPDKWVALLREGGPLLMAALNVLALNCFQRVDFHILSGSPVVLDENTDVLNIPSCPAAGGLYHHKLPFRSTN